MKLSLARYDIAKMNVQKISKFIPVIAAFLFLFGFARGALAITLTGEYNATTNEICIPTQGEDYWYPFQGWGFVQYARFYLQFDTQQDFSGDLTVDVTDASFGSGSGSWVSPAYGGTPEIPNDFCLDLDDSTPTKDWFYIVIAGRDEPYYGYTSHNDYTTFHYDYIYTAEFYQGTPVLPDTSSRIDSFSFSTTTAQATITGYWNATTTPYITERLTFWQYSDTLGQESYEQLIATTTGAFSFTFDFRDHPYTWTSGESSTTPIYTSFTLNASLDQYDETNYVFPYGGRIIDNLDATSTTISISDYNASDFISTPRDLALYPEYECDLFHLSGCLKNAAIWLFYPTQNALDSWTTLKTTLETKAPFGYFYSVKNAVVGLSATSTPSFNIVIPAHLKTYFFDPFDTGVAGILWLFFIFHFYKRLKHIQI